MATTTAQDQTLDYEHFIDYQLARAQGRIKGVDTGSAMVRLITAALVYLLVVIGLDRAFALAGSVRLVLLVAILLAGFAYVAVAVIVPGVRRINSFYAARTIERSAPEFQNSLINFLDLRRRPQEVPSAVLAALEERAVADLSQIQVEEKISQERLIRASYRLAAAVLTACVAVLFNALFMPPGSLLDSLGRALLPTADIQPPTKTLIVDVKPGDDPDQASLVAHTDVTVSAIVQGTIPKQVSLYWSDDAGKFWREQHLTAPERKFDRWRVQLSLVEKPFDYYLVGGDCRTKKFHLDVVSAPMVTDLELMYEYPEYTGWPNYSSSNGNIDALEGTWVTITATTNRPARNGQLQFGPNKRSGPAMQLVAGRDDQLTTRLQVTQNDSYIVWFETPKGETNPRPTSYEIKVRKDLVPTVAITKPGTDLVEPPVPANAIIPLVVTARDDFGIEQVTLYVAQGQETLQTFDLTDGQSPGKEFNGTHRLDLAGLRLGAGSEITYWANAADNRQPSRNHTETPHFRIRLASPLPPEDRQRELARAEDAE